MSQKQVRARLAGMLTITIFVLVVLVWRWGSPEATGTAGDPPAKGQPVLMPANLTGLLVTLGQKDEKGLDWSGEVSVSQGKVLAVDILQGNAKGKVEGNKFVVRSAFLVKKDENKKKKKTDQIIPPIIRVTLDAPNAASVK
ncbi:MAG: hypothetical protein L0215_27395, partial [Gemmataceae bacterium]|nr:hypothetical protein [Gemmataceae bacterium]